MDLSTDAKNIQAFWEKLKTMKKNGDLLGVGSPEHELGDAHVNELGIYAGHAYAVLDV